MAITETVPPIEDQNQGRVSFHRLFIRALGVSFLSLISLGLALLLFTSFPQVQDLFFDARPYAYQGVIYWFWFYIIGMLFWVLPLVFTARLLLQQNYQAIGVDTQARYKIIVLDLPKAFTPAAFIIILAGIYLAASDLPDDTKTSEVEGFIYGYLTNHIIYLFAFTALFAIFVFYRNFFVRRYFRFMEGFEKRRPKTFRSILIGFERLAVKHDYPLKPLSFHLEELRPSFLSREEFIAGQRGKVFMCLYLLSISAIILLLIAIHFLYYSTFSDVNIGEAFVSSLPDDLRSFVLFISDTLWLQRAALLPMLFGAWLPFMAFLALLSNRYQFPFIAALIATVVALTIFVSDGHDLRILKTSPQTGPQEAAFSLTKAIDLWKAKNGWVAKGCDSLGIAPGGGENCPRPIIIAGEGGGSRAGFFLGSALGWLQDESLRLRRSGVMPTRVFSDQVFAISSVSGSSVGAAFFTAALSKHPQPEDKARTREVADALFRQRLWFQNVARPERQFLTDHVTYKDALQAVFSNDFLSPVLVGYLARDVTTISRLPFVFDRAGILERSWETTFDSIYELDGETSLLAAPFLQFTPSGEQWTPLLVFNATSFETGRRVIVSPLSASEALPASPARMFAMSEGEKLAEKTLLTDAYDLYAMLCVDRDLSDLSPLDQIASFLPRFFSPIANIVCENGKPENLDVRLSTAAGLSSRFPIISPHANIRDRVGNISDSLVDGGYFDNSGAITAVEIAEAMKSLDPNLDPYILQISSEPEWFVSLCNPGEADRQPGPPIPDEADFKPFGTLGSLLTVNATRIARGYQTILELPEQIRNVNGGKPSHALIHVCPQERKNLFLSLVYSDAKRSRKGQEQTPAFKSVSLSWWLSPPLQAFLDAQLYLPHNNKAIADVLKLLEE